MYSEFQNKLGTSRDSDNMVWSAIHYQVGIVQLVYDTPAPYLLCLDSWSTQGTTPLFFCAFGHGIQGKLTSRPIRNPLPKIVVGRPKLGSNVHC
jgi:hypothetical protein